MVVLVWLYRKLNPTGIVITLISSAVIEYFANELYGLNSMRLMGVLAECFLYFQCVIVGYASAKYRIIEKMKNVMHTSVTVSGMGVILILIIKRFANHFVGGRGILG